jgi:hypothetical protein
MRLALVTTVLAMVLASVAAPALAVAAAAKDPTSAQISKAISSAKRSKALWATVNICNSPSHPNQLGIRGQMPALGFPAWLSMRIQLNYYSDSQKKFVVDPGSTKMIRLGRSRSGLQQGGAVYAFNPHAGLLNASVRFDWRRSGKLLGSTTQTTTGGHRGADFGSPPHFTAAQCRIR